MMRGNSFYFEKMNGVMNLVGPEVSWGNFSAPGVRNRSPLVVKQSRHRNLHEVTLLAIGVY